MLDTPRITRSAGQAAAVIPFSIPRSEFWQHMRAGISELIAVIAAQGIAPAGPVFSHHLKITPETIDFELGLPVTRPVAPAGRVKPGALPAATVARALYRGPYEGLRRAWSEVDAWVTAQGRTPAPDRWISYVDDPQSNPDPSTWRSELNRPLES